MKISHITSININNNTKLHGYSAIGMQAQDINTTTPIGQVEIGENVNIREFVTIGSPKISENKNDN